METITENKSMVKVIVLEDNLSHWSDKISNFVEKIETVYMYDASTVTYCAEVTPSFYLIPLYYIVTPLNETCESIVEEVEAEFYNEEPIYVHVHSIANVEGQIFANQDFNYTDAESDEYKECIEEVEEYLKCNHVI